MPCEGVAAVTQASAAFAARAAMGRPPFLEPVSWMGSSLLPVQHLDHAVQLLKATGAQRVLIAQTRISAQIKQDPLWLTAACAQPEEEGAIPGAARLVVQMPPHIGTMSFGDIAACMELGRCAAEQELDRLLETMGMAYCRVLPFKRS